MTQSLPQLILPIKMERSPERLTRLGGLVVVEELARRQQGWEGVDQAMEGPQSGRGYQPSEFVQALVWMLHAGGRRLEDLRELRAAGEVLQKLGLRAAPDAGTVGDWLRRQGEAGVAAMQAVNRDWVQGVLQPEPEEVPLEVDATEIEAEKEEARWTYHKVKGYMPLLGYVNGVCVGQQFRAGHASPGAGILEFAQDWEAAWPRGKRVYFRSDSAAYQAQGIHHYSEPGRSFTITADLDAAVKREMGNLPQTAGTPYRTREGIATDREIAETVHTMNETKPAFRLIVLRWPNPQPDLFAAGRYCYHAVASNRPQAAVEVIWKHNERGNSENGHKELKSGFGMEQMPCGQFQAKALYFAMGCWRTIWRNC